MNRLTSRPFALALLASALFFASAPAARADLAPPPDPDCDQGQADGTPCHDSRGTCQTSEDRGRTRHRCVEDDHPCDRLALGAVCRQSPLSHCREFTGDRGETWRACQDDEVEAARVASTMASGTEREATPPPSTRSRDRERGPAPETRPGEAASDCAVSMAGLRSNGGLLAFAAFALGLAIVSRRTRPR